MLTPKNSRVLPEAPARFGSWAGLLLGSVFLLFPLAHWRLIPLGTSAIYAAEIPLFILLLWMLVRAARSDGTIQEFRGALRAPWFLSALLVLSGAAASYLLTVQTPTGLGQIKSFYVLPVCFAFALSVLARSRSLQESILATWFLGCMAAALAGVITWHVGFLTYDGRLTGPYASPNHLAMLLSPAVLIGLAAILSRSAWPEKVSWFLGTGLIALALWATHAYGTWAALFLAGGCFVVLALRPERRRFWLGVLLVGLLLWSASEFKSDKWHSLVTLDARSALASRSMIWQAAGKITLDSLPWGIGPGNFQAVYLEYQRFFPPYLEWAVPHPHNLALFFILETGLLGFLGFCGVLFFGLRSFRIAWMKTVSEADKKRGALLLSLLVLYLGMGLVDTPYPKSDLALALWGVLGLMAAWSRGSGATS